MTIRRMLNNAYDLTASVCAWIWAAVPDDARVAAPGGQDLVPEAHQADGRPRRGNARRALPELPQRRLAVHRRHVQQPSLRHLPANRRVLDFRKVSRQALSCRCVGLHRCPRPRGCPGCCSAHVTGCVLVCVCSDAAAWGAGRICGT
eukprot:2659292-Rhodomonas_salina.1